MRQVDSGPGASELTATLESVRHEIRRVLLRFRIPAQDAEDLLQDVVLVYLAKQGQIHSPAPWILSALKNRCLKYWRSRRRHLIEAIDRGLLEEVAGSCPPAQEQSDLSRDLSGALAQLPSRCQNVLRLRYGFDYKGPEIAEKLGYRKDSVRQITLRCLSALSRQLTSIGFGSMEALS